MQDQETKGLGHRWPPSSLKLLALWNLIEPTLVWRMMPEIPPALGSRARTATILSQKNNTETVRWLSRYKRLLLHEDPSLICRSHSERRANSRLSSDPN
ncbi:mCG146912 [Mus musculus]|nr:mCG146912 [Mus musculus]